MRKNQSFLQGLLDFSPAAVYIKDLQGRYVLVNNYFASLIQKMPESCIGKTDDDLFDMEVATVFRHNDQQILQAGGGG